MNADERISLPEIMNFLTFKTSRSGGAGGQHVNKVSTKVLLEFDLHACTLFSSEQKSVLTGRLSSRMQADGKIQIISQSSRSQLTNKQEAVSKLLNLLTEALKEPKPRKKTRRPGRANQKRLDEKRRQSLKKIARSSRFSAGG